MGSLKRVRFLQWVPGHGDTAFPGLILANSVAGGEGKGVGKHWGFDAHLLVTRVGEEVVGLVDFSDARGKLWWVGFGKCRYIGELSVVRPSSLALTEGAARFQARCKGGQGSLYRRRG